MRLTGSRTGFARRLVIVLISVSPRRHRTCGAVPIVVVALPSIDGADKKVLMI